MFSQFFERIGLTRLTPRQKLVFGGLWTIALVIVAAFLWSLRWSPGEIEQARAAYAAILEVEAANGFVRRRGGAIDDLQADELKIYYQRASELSAKAGDDVLRRVHADLPEIWHGAFLRSTRFYLDAIAKLDRDGAREASLIQDDWFRWYNLHRGELDIPDEARRISNGATK
ncbi:MAG: hypothetical protein FJX59_09255 [Alphaproteobacteria bacterium]|nr:hypothetical protein [Alphaproteobacteria bacterium]